MKAYLAGSIFYLGDKFRNEYFSKKLREAFPQIDLYNPLENAAINDKTKFADARAIANGDNERLDKCDILIACIDGDVLPSGTCSEIGKFHEKIARGDDKLLIGICTDTRQQYLTHSPEKDATFTEPGECQYCYENLYVTGLIKQGGALVTSIEDAIAAIEIWRRKHPQFKTEAEVKQELTDFWEDK